LWCDAVGHARKDCRDFTEALRTKVVYLSNGRVHDCETRKMLDLNVGKGGMKRLMEEAAARHAETVHYSASAGIRVGGEESRKAKDSGFWPSMLEGLAGVRLKKEEADRAERRVQKVTGWNDPVEEKTGFVEAACQNYEVLVEEKRAGRGGGAGPSQCHETRIADGRRYFRRAGEVEEAQLPDDDGDRANHRRSEGSRGADPRQPCGAYAPGGAWHRQVGSPRLHRGLGEAEEAVDGAGTGEAGGGTNDVP
jgi:hypothetical protein